MRIVINSTKLGRLTVESDRLITFSEGILGFPAVRRYVLIENDKGHPFFWLQAMEDNDLSFVITDPCIFIPDYKPRIPQDDLDHLEIKLPEEKVILTIVTVPQDDPLKLTANLMAPLVFNTKTRKGRQIVLYDCDYNIREPLLEVAAAVTP